MLHDSRLLRNPLELQSATALEPLFDCMDWRMVRASPRYRFRELGCPEGDFILVKQGILSILQIADNGTRSIAALRYAGEFIQPREASVGFFVQSLVASEVLIGRSDNLRQVLKQNEALAWHVSCHAERNHAISYQWLSNRGRHAEARVAHLLCETAYRVGVSTSEKIELPFTQVQIAEMTALTPVHVCRILGKLAERGIVTRRGRGLWARPGGPPGRRAVSSSCRQSGS